MMVVNSRVFGLKPPCCQNFSFCCCCCCSYLFIFRCLFIINFIVAAPQPSLELLPDNLLLRILSLLDVHSLISLSRVCKRFHHLYTDEYIWNDADLRSRSVGSKLNVHKLKKIVHDRIPSTLQKVKLSSNHPRKPPVVTAAVLNDLLNKCSGVKNITVETCDLTTVYT